MSFPARQSTASGGPAHLTVVETNRPSADRARAARSARAAETPDLEPLAVEVQRRNHVTIVQPRGELDLATAETLCSTLDVAIAETLSTSLDGMEHGARLVLDLRGLSFIDSTGLHLLVALDQRAQREGFQLTLLAPAAPIDRAIQLCGLDQMLPFAAPADAVDTEPRESSPEDRGSEVLSDVW
jgi:anti-sigma B factor antagonist